MSYGNSPFGLGPYGGGPSPFELTGARAINPYTVRLTFNEEPDLSLASTVNPTSYVIQKVGGGYLTPRRIVADPDPFSLLVLTLEAYEYDLYQVTVDDDVLSVTGGVLDSAFRTAQYTGFPVQGILQAQALRPTAVLVLFGQEMVADLALTLTTNYVVMDAGGAQVPIVGVTPNIPSAPTRVTLELASPLLTQQFYSLTVSEQVLSTQGLTVTPSSVAIQPYNLNRLARVPVTNFTGEVHSELFGNPNGLVFFSPALIPSGAPNSSLQVDEVEARTRAYDEYVFPVLPDPNLLYTYKSGPLSTLNRDSLFASLGRISETKMTLRGLNKESFRYNQIAYPTSIALSAILGGSSFLEVEGSIGAELEGGSSLEATLDLCAPVDALHSQTLILRYDPLETALLNNPGFQTFRDPMPSVGDFIAEDDHVSPAWVLFDASPENVPYLFVLVNNNNYCVMDGDSSLVSELSAEWVADATLDGDSSFDPQDLSAEWEADATLDGDSSLASDLVAEWVADATLGGDSSFVPQVLSSEISATLGGDSSLASDLVAEWVADSTLDGDSSFVPQNLHTDISATLGGDSSLVSDLSAEWVADSTLDGDSSFVPQNLHTDISATLDGDSSLVSDLSAEWVADATLDGDSSFVPQDLSAEWVADATLDGDSNVTSALDVI
jgi:hypothetical protein